MQKRADINGLWETASTAAATPQNNLVLTGIMDNKRPYGFRRPYIEQMIHRYLDADCSPVPDTGGNLYNGFACTKEKGRFCTRSTNRHNYVPSFLNLHKYALFRLFINLITCCI